MEFYYDSSKHNEWTSCEFYITCGTVKYEGNWATCRVLTRVCKADMPDLTVVTHW